MMDLGVQTMKRVRSVKRVSAGVESGGVVMHSAASADWGTPMLLRRFFQVVLLPACKKKGRSIDLDYSTSAYWQSWWPDGDSPQAYLDGSPGKDVLVQADRQRICPARERGSGFLNPAGLDGGSMVQRSWELFEKDHAEERLGSGGWMGFSLEHFSSLQGISDRSPLTTGPDDLITTIVPSRRCRYLLHPEQFIAMTRKKQAKREKGSKLWRAEQRKIENLMRQKTSAPVPGAAPSHASYLTILWSPVRSIRSRQMSAARQFLAEQRRDEKSLLYRFEAIGPLDMDK